MEFAFLSAALARMEAKSLSRKNAALSRVRGATNGSAREPAAKAHFFRKLDANSRISFWFKRAKFLLR